ncbi:MAG: hypothetical protein HC873_16480 [Leptolyngbyaceae cyanobacterium SL_1_1]|nr:hypothetical protein [Leptolyngbyaceae cyanobacterium SL_1_1]
MEDSTTSAPLNTQPSPWEESESGPETNRQNRDSSSNSGDLANSSGKVAPVSPGSEMLPSEMPTPTTDTR